MPALTDISAAPVPGVVVGTKTVPAGLVQSPTTDTRQAEVLAAAPAAADPGLVVRPVAFGAEADAEAAAGNGSLIALVKNLRTRLAAVETLLAAATPAGTNNIGDVDIASIAAGDNNIGNVDVLTLPALPAGTNAIGKLAANSGVDIGDVDVTSLPAITGTVTANAGTGTMGVQPVRAGTGTHANVAGSATNVTLLAANANRLGYSIFNDSTAILYVKHGATASATSHKYQIAAGGYYETPAAGVYTGVVEGIWASATGSARVTEETA